MGQAAPEEFCELPNIDRIAMAEQQRPFDLYKHMLSDNV